MAVEIGELRSVLDGRWAGIRDEVRAQIDASPLLRPAHGLPVEEHRARVMEQARVVSQTRSARLFFPREYGGEGDMGGALSAFETIALVDLSLLVKVGVQYGLFGGVIRRLGTRRHHERYLRAAMTMELPGCFAMTETGHGSDVQSIRTTATYDPQRQEFVIHTPDDDARKDYIGNVARDGRLAAVFAQLITGGERRGVHVLLVPIRDERERPCPNVRIEDCGHKGGLNGVDNGRLWFNQVRVPREALLDRFGSVAPDGTYTSPIANETRRFFTMLGTLVSGLKAISTWHSTQTIQTCREACGGAGYLSVNRLTELRADTDIFTTFEGDNTVLLQLVAKGLLTNFRDEFGSMDTVAMVRYVADQVVSAVLERTAARSLGQLIADAIPRGEEGSSILDREYHAYLFAWREKHVLEAAARRLRKLMANDGDAFAAFNAVQDHLLLAARAHVERVILEHFKAAIDRCDDAETKSLLDQVCDLHVLASLERDRAWFLEHGQLSASRAKAVITNVNRLCRDLRPHARLLVDAFGIPEELLPELVAEAALPQETPHPDPPPQGGREIVGTRGREI